MKRLKFLRENNGFSKKEVSSLLGITIYQYSQYEDEKKDIPIKFLSTLARKYDTSIDYIVGDTNEPEAHKKMT